MLWQAGEGIVVNISVLANNQKETHRCLPDMMRLQVSAQEILIYSSFNDTTALVPISSAQLLSLCSSQSRTLEEHATEICITLQIPPSQKPAVLQQLDSLLAKGLLVPHSKILERCRSGSSDEPPPPIASLGIPTRNRPSALRRCATSFARQARHFQRDLNLVVADSSDRGHEQESNLEVLRQVRDQFGLKVSYIGKAERQAYVQALAKQADISPETVEFALLNPEGFPIDIGSNRNALLLNSVDSLSVQADDDMICHVLSGLQRSQGVDLSSSFNLSGLWYPAEGEDNFLDWKVEPDTDCLTLHEQLLGKSLSSCLAGLPPGMVNSDGIREHFFSKIGLQGGRVLTTQMGIAGDSGMSESAGLLFLRGSDRARLHSCEAQYKRAIAHQRIACAPARYTIAAGGACLAGNLGVDARTLLPPFLPVQRGEDNAFGLLINSTVVGGFSGYLPYMILHEPFQPKLRLHENLWQSVTRLECGSWCGFLLSSLWSGLAHDTQNNFQSVSRLFINLGSMAEADFAEVLSRLFFNWAQVHLSELESIQAEFDRKPEYWSNDIKKRMAWLTAGLEKGEFLIPDDLLPGRHPSEARLMLQRLILRFGQLLGDWPAIWQAALELSHQGHRLARTIIE